MDDQNIQQSNQQQLTVPKYTVTGQSSPMLVVEFNGNGAKFYGRSGSMAWMSPDIKMTTQTKHDGIKNFIFDRSHSLINVYECPLGNGVVALSPETDGQILNAELNPQYPDLLVAKGASLAMDSSIDSKEVILNKSMFPGMSLEFEKLSGTGTVHFASHGDSVVYVLNEEQDMIIDESHLLAFDSTVKVVFERLESSLLNSFFSGEGLYIAKVKGPGRIWLQSKNPDNGSKDKLSRIFLVIAFLLLSLIILF